MARIIQLSELLADARFGEIISVREFIKPKTYQVASLYKSIVPPTASSDEVTLICWKWVVENIQYSLSDSYALYGGGINIMTNEYWELPYETLAWKKADCDGMAILLTSLLRNKFQASDIYVTVGNLKANNNIGGHAWVIVKRGGEDYILESTIKKVPDNPWRRASDLLDKYQPKVYFNDKEIWAAENDLTVLPQNGCDIKWMNDLWCGCEI